ncbi:hypothetical protein SAMN00768000_0145 [Sulfobacillus thermosulfidooxidans DSM 9293]|uniref:Uncharacterized protein n=1 Tax=Sulfobacillus thermosulfidooxidans (strain DSM 9293 / VKM B-1269 / AT-1) TaxID=929705 RepID=A0A1W1W770_SULTA|nr:hypothetical protein SAMN00768000_0145 [Sulfobacillus thermosulfidooxidans DSM 9293]
MSVILFSIAQPRTPFLRTVDWGVGAKSLWRAADLFRLNGNQYSC